MNDGIKEILAKRRDRACAILLGFKERECDEYLPEHVSAALRKQILDQLNDFYDVSIDLLRSVDSNGVVMNEEFLARMFNKIDEIHEILLEDDI